MQPKSKIFTKTFKLFKEFLLLSILKIFHMKSKVGLPLVTKQLNNIKSDCLLEGKRWFTVYQIWIL